MLGAFVLFVVSQTQLPPLKGYMWPVVGCVGICLGPVIYLVYWKVSKWKKTAVAMETRQDVPELELWRFTQDKSYYMDG